MATTVTVPLTRTSVGGARCPTRSCRAELTAGVGTRPGTATATATGSSDLYRFGRGTVTMTTVVKIVVVVSVMGACAVMRVLQVSVDDLGLLRTGVNAKVGQAASGAVPTGTGLRHHATPTGIGVDAAPTLG